MLISFLIKLVVIQTAYYLQNNKLHIEAHLPTFTKVVPFLNSRELLHLLS